MNDFRVHFHHQGRLFALTSPDRAGKLAIQSTPIGGSRVKGERTVKDFVKELEVGLRNSDSRNSAAGSLTRLDVHIHS